MPMVVFDITARIKLEQRLARQLAKQSGSLERKMNDIEQTLQLVFPAAKVAIVQDLYSGFRIRDEEHILLVEVERLVQSVRDDARRMLVDATLWLARKPDDYIWIPATQGEANVLLGNWPAAEMAYAEAIRQAAGKKFYHDCMRDQIKNLLFPTFQRLGIPFEGELSDLDDFFALTPEVPK